MWSGIYQYVASHGTPDGEDEAATGPFRPPSPPTPVDPAHYYYVESEQVDDGGSGGDATATESGIDGDRRRGGKVRIPVAYVVNGEPLPGPPPRRRRNNQIPRHGARTRSRSRSHSRSRSRLADGSSPICTSSRPVLLYCHGHDDDLGSVLGRLRSLSKGLGVDAVGFDYAGYGSSHAKPRVVWGDEAAMSKDEGEETTHASPSAAKRGLVPSEDQVHSDVRAVYDHLTTRCGINPRDVILYGKSLGSAAACRLVRDLLRTSMRRQLYLDGPGGSGDAGPPAGGLVLHSAFKDGDALTQMGLGETLSAAVWGRGGERKAPFPTEGYARDIAVLGGAVPTYFVHGVKDGVVPLEHGQRLFGLVNEGMKRYFPPFWAEGEFFIWMTTKNLASFGGIRIRILTLHSSSF